MYDSKITPKRMCQKQWVRRYLKPVCPLFCALNPSKLTAFLDHQTRPNLDVENKFWSYKVPSILPVIYYNALNYKPEESNKTKIDLETRSCSKVSGFVFFVLAAFSISMPVPV